MTMDRKQEESEVAKTSLDESRVLSHAVAQIALRWRLGDELLGSMLGIPKSRAERLAAGGFQLARSHEAFRVGQYLVCAFEGLGRLLGDDETVIAWLNAENRDFAARPIDLIRTPSGMKAVAAYVESFLRQSQAVDSINRSILIDRKPT